VPFAHTGSSPAWGRQEDNVDRWTSIDETLEFAIAEEQAAADFYAGLAGRTDVPGMSEALLSFAQEEMGHKAKLEAVKAGVGMSPAARPVIDLKIADYVADVVPDPQMSYRDTLIVAMKKEKAAFRLYTDLAAATADAEIRSLFLALAQEEARHKLRFEIEYDDLLEEN
jgi:rubrerythrin